MACAFRLRGALFPATAPTYAGAHPMARFRRSRASRRGATTFESILVLIVLIIASFAVFQFGLALIVKQAVSHAATVAAREAAKGADADELVQVVDRVLEGHQIKIGRDAALLLEQGPSPGQRRVRGDLPCDGPEQPEIDNDEVRVTVCVNLTARPFLNILKAYGIDFRGRTFEISSVVTKE
jgi:hypothetical protein